MSLARGAVAIDDLLGVSGRSERWCAAQSVIRITLQYNFSNSSTEDAFTEARNHHAWQVHMHMCLSGRAPQGCTADIRLSQFFRKVARRRADAVGEPDRMRFAFGKKFFRSLRNCPKLVVVEFKLQEVE